MRPPGFTLIELIIVMTLLAILALVGLMDYGVSIRKARLEVAVEGLIFLFEDAQVKTQTKSTDPDAGSSDFVVECWGLRLELNELPVVVKAPWEEQACVWAEATIDQSVQWDDSIQLFGWKVEQLDGVLSAEQTNPLWMTFSPPQGDMVLYTGSQDFLNRLSDVNEVALGIAYGRETSEVWSKTLTVVPVTSNFVISPGYE